MHASAVSVSNTHVSDTRYLPDTHVSNTHIYQIPMQVLDTPVSDTHISDIHTYKIPVFLIHLSFWWSMPTLPCPTAYNRVSALAGDVHFLTI